VLLVAKELPSMVSVSARERGKARGRAVLRHHPEKEERAKAVQGERLRHRRQQHRRRRQSCRQNHRWSKKLNW
jgi:hypothetical protein